MYPSNTHLGLEWEEVAIGSPDGVLGAVGPLHKDHVDVALVRETLVHTVHLTASDVGCIFTWVGKVGRKRNKGRGKERREGEGGEKERRKREGKKRGRGGEERYNQREKEKLAGEQKMQYPLQVILVHYMYPIIELTGWNACKI